MTPWLKMTIAFWWLVTEGNIKMPFIRQGWLCEWGRFQRSKRNSSWGSPVGPEPVALHRFHVIQHHALRNRSRSLFYNRCTLRKFTPPIMLSHTRATFTSCLEFIFSGFIYADCFCPSLTGSHVHITKALQFRWLKGKVSRHKGRVKWEHVVIIHSIKALFPRPILLEP